MTNEQRNAYFMDHESGAEMTRLLDQDRLINRSMGGLLPELEDLSTIRHVLDVACGPGGWAQELAFAHPEMQVTGIDISEAMIAYASQQAQVQHLPNVQFRVMDVTQPLDFADGTFDLVNARAIGFFYPPLGEQLLSEFVRVARPGGIIRLTECEVGESSTSPAHERFWDLFARLLKQRGQSFSLDGRLFGFAPQLGLLLRRAGCHQIHKKAHLVDGSAGAEGHSGYVEDMKVAFQNLKPSLLQAGLATEEELDQLYDQLLIEMMDEEFQIIQFLLTAWGYTPEHPAS